MKIKKLITTLSLSAFLLSGLAVPTFAAESKSVDSKIKAMQALNLKDAVLKAANLKEQSKPLKSLLGSSRNYVSTAGTERISDHTSLPGTDLWTHALQEGDNNYYWGYSYYYNNNHQHYAIATLNGEAADDTKLSGDTAHADSDSFQNPRNFKAIAGIGEASDYYN